MANITTPRVVDAWIEYPFLEQGEDAKVYHLECIVDTSSYSPKSITNSAHNLGSASNAGVEALPYSWANASAYFVGDTEPQPYGFQMLRFVRSFAEVPAAFSDYGSAVKTFFAQYSASLYDPNYVIRNAGSETVSTRIDYQFSRTIGSITIYAEARDPTLLSTGFAVNYVRSGYTTNPNAKNTVLQGTQVTRWRGGIYQGITVYYV